MLNLFPLLCRVMAVLSVLGTLLTGWLYRNTPDAFVVGLVSLFSAALSGLFFEGARALAVKVREQSEELEQLQANTTSRPREVEPPRKELRRAP